MHSQASNSNVVNQVKLLQSILQLGLWTVADDLGALFVIFHMDFTACA